jgi:hypothetical protein
MSFVPCLRAARRGALAPASFAFVVALLVAPACADAETTPRHESGDRGRRSRSHGGWSDERSFPAVHRETKEQRFTLAGGRGKVTIDNIAGDVIVRAGDGDTVHVVARQTARGRDDESLALGRREMPLLLEQRGDTVRAFVDAPFRDGDDGMHFDGDDYDYRVVWDFEVTVPRGVDISAESVMDGEVEIHGVHGRFDIRNVNGPVTLEAMGGHGEVRTVNANLQVSFARNPTGDCVFDNVNGKVDVTFAPGLGADVRYKTLNGEAWSDFPFTTYPVTPQTGERRRSGLWRVGSDWQEGIRIGAGGPTLSFRTINGNIYLRERGNAASGR